MASKRKPGANKARRAARRAAAPAGSRMPGSEPRTPGSEPRTPGSGPRTPGSGPRTPGSGPRTAEPAFWFGFEISTAKLVVARVVLFGLLAIDALMQIRHAPRYGAGGFNVGQISIFDTLGPGRTSYELGELVTAYLFVLFACGVGTRKAMPIAAAIYSWLYFGSQLDSYQHHYLVALLLWIACFVPWERPPGATAGTPVRSWAVRLMLVQLAIMYLWAAISKLNPGWLDGTALAQQITGPMRTLIVHTAGFAVASCTVLAVELSLAATVWSRRTWPAAAVLGIGLHLGILFSGLDIGIFAWLMLALYALVIPDRIWVWLAGPASQLRLGDAARWLGGRARWLIWTIAALGAIGLAAACRFEHTLALAIVLGFVLAARTFAAVVRGRPHVAWLAAAHLIAIATWVVVDRASTVAYEYYLYWGGSSRRLGDPESAMRAYARVVEIAPDKPAGHYHYGVLLLEHGHADEGLEQLHDAEQLDPGEARPLLAEAEWLASHGRRDEAREKARKALHVAPNDRAARRLVEILERP